MPRRRESVAPQDPMAVMMAKIAKIEAELIIMRQAGPSALHADDWEKTSEPVPWQTQIHHPGAHVDATPSDPLVYYHPGDEDVGGSTTPGFKGIGAASPIPWVRRKRGSSLDGGTTPATLFPWGGDTPLVFDDGGDEGHASVAGSTDWQSYFSFDNDHQTRILQDGYYGYKGNVHWVDMDEDKTYLVSLHDGFLWSEGWTFQTFSSWESPSHMWQTWKRKQANDIFFLQVQFSGITDERASSWYMEIARFGSFTGAMSAPDDIGDE